MSRDANEFTLVISEKGGAERRQVFRTPEVTIGRVPGNDIVLAKGNVSKKHARLLFREGRLIVTDLNSTNGTLVNRRKISQATILRPEDRLFIGDYVFRVELQPTAPDLLGLDTPERFVAPSLPGPVVRIGSDADSGAFATLVPSPDRISEPPGARSSSAPPRKSDSGEASGRLHEPTAVRIAVARIVQSLVAARGTIALEMDDAMSRSLGEQVAGIVDQLLVDGQIPVGTSGETIHDAAVSELTGLGALRALLDDPEVTAVSASRFDQLVEVREGRLQPCSSSFSCPLALEWAVLRLLRGAKVSPDLGGRIADVRLELGPSVWQASFAKSDAGWLFKMDRLGVSPGADDDWVRRGVLSRAMASFLSSAMQARLNVLVVAATPADARAFGQVLLQSAAKERVFWLGDGAESAPGRATPLSLPVGSAEHLRVFEVASTLPLARLVLAPSDAVAWSHVFERGLRGGASFLCLLPGAGLAKTIARLPADLVRRAEAVPLEVAAAWVASAFDLAVEVARLSDGRLRVTRISEFHAGLELRDIFAFQGSRSVPGGGTEGSFVQAVDAPRVLSLIQAAGVRSDSITPSRTSDPG